MWLIRRQARASYNGSIDLEDLVQDGILGLLEGLARFDCARQPPVRLLSFAGRWIERRIKRAGQAGDLRYGGSRLPEAVYYEAGRLRRTERDLGAALGREPSTAELAEHVAMSPARVRWLQEIRSRSVQSLLAGPDEPEVFAAACAETALDDLLRKERTARVRSEIRRLPGDERAYVRWRFGIEGSAPPPLGAVTHLHRRALARLRQFLGE